MKTRRELNIELDRIERQLKVIRREVNAGPAPAILAVSAELHTDLTNTIETFRGWLEAFRGA